MKTQKTTRLILSVTGHRQIGSTELQLSEGLLTTFLQELRPAQVLNPLANGADQLVAQVCCKLHIPWQAVLPMPLDRYKTSSILGDFPRADQAGQRLKAEKQFDQLLLQAKSTIHLYEDLPFSADKEGEIYQALAQYLLTQSDALLAIWDGFDNGKKGGTADVVNKAKAHNTKIYHLSIPSKENPRPAFTAYSWQQF